MTQDQEKVISKCNTVLQLKDNPSWQALLDDVQRSYMDIAESWCDIPENKPEVLREARVRQLANKYLLTVLDQYEATLKDVQMDIIKEDHPNEIAAGDVDNNPSDVKDDEYLGEVVYDQ